MDWTFGTFLWSTLLIFLWFSVIWMFVAIFADIIRRDMSGWAKAGWVVLVLFLPFLGILIYLIARPRTERWGGRMLGEADRNGYRVTNHHTADEIGKAARLYDSGKITADEYEQIKQQALNAA